MPSSAPEVRDGRLTVAISADQVLAFAPDRASKKAGQGFGVAAGGGSRLDAMRSGRYFWNVRPVPRDFITPVRSDIPILMLSGTDDPASPPQYGRAALPYLPNARQILIPHAPHEIELPCADELVMRLLRTRSAKGLDAASCVASSRRPPFVTSPRPGL